MNRLAKCVLRTDYATYAVSNNENPRREYQHYGSSAFYRTEAFPFGTTGKIGAGQPAEDHRLRIEGRNSPYNEASARVMPKQTTARPPMFSVALACPPKLTIVYVEVPSNRIEPNIGSDSDKGGAKASVSACVTKFTVRTTSAGCCRFAAAALGGSIAVSADIVQSVYEALAISNRRAGCLQLLVQPWIRNTKGAEAT